jgi:hypothetical protein
MIFPATIGPTDPTGWGVVISYEGAGYVKDNDAAEIDYKLRQPEISAFSRFLPSQLFRFALIHQRRYSVDQQDVYWLALRQIAIPQQFSPYKFRS